MQQEKCKMLAIKVSSESRISMTLRTKLRTQDSSHPHAEKREQRKTKWYLARREWRARNAVKSNEWEQPARLLANHGHKYRSTKRNPRSASQPLTTQNSVFVLWLDKGEKPARNAKGERLRRGFKVTIEGCLMTMSAGWP
ncbi:uncharacterized protein MCYG_03194 [Microsporum canis CBS 113480]|uniref:Uncharacterized protein n=1 Tax=Arthroderma otae (strain ATCC MYA-4605 / CBS 113480) TaxID=554155 RepID=C5FL03_ARTOC|nr:uncharacterized protein MCYG_03194 [Microsporum canis CBS 113480]EEQ30375.1 predicted protein [Microsporum canis CBS 113480]